MARSSRLSGSAAAARRAGASTGYPRWRDDLTGRTGASRGRIAAMGFLKRIFARDEPAATTADVETPAKADPDGIEGAYDLDLARAEQDRLDELSQRQLRYAEYAWQPPKQGGDRRADDGDAADAG